MARISCSGSKTSVWRDYMAHQIGCRQSQGSRETYTSKLLDFREELLKHLRVVVREVPVKLWYD